MKRMIQTLTLAAAAAVALSAQNPTMEARNLEPNAGKWKTWTIASGAAYRAPAPPSAAATRAELHRMREMRSQVNDATRRQINYWDAGAPAYRWMDMIERRVEAGEVLTAHPHRVMMYVALAMYDATVAAWDSKYAYNRPRPTDLDPTMEALVSVPSSPSYPSEHSAAAAAAAVVLAHFFPSQDEMYHRMATEAGMSRVLAGVQFPSDHNAGMEIGRRVAQKVIERIGADGYTTAWNGTIPTGTCMWTGVNPGNAAATGWRTVLLSSASEFRLPPPPDCQSTQIKADVTAVRTYTRTFASDWKSFYWQSPEGRETKPFIMAEKWMFEDGMDRNPPRAARVYALLAAAHYDTFIASQDSKFAYWYLRPHQLDSGVKPLFAVPNFPSYPSNHSSFSWSRAAMLTYLFPNRAADASAMATEAADSRIWAGLHYTLDADAGKTLGRAVAAKFIDWAENDGSK